MCVCLKVFFGGNEGGGGWIWKNHNGGQWNGSTTQARRGKEERRILEKWWKGKLGTLLKVCWCMSIARPSLEDICVPQCSQKAVCQLHVRWMNLTVIVCPMWTTGGVIHLHFCLNVASEHLNKPEASWKSILLTEECKMQISLCLTNSWDYFVSLFPKLCEMVDRIGVVERSGWVHIRQVLDEVNIACRSSLNYPFFLIILQPCPSPTFWKWLQDFFFFFYLIMLQKSLFLFLVLVSS